MSFPKHKVSLICMREQTANIVIIRMGFGGEFITYGMRSIARREAEESDKFRTDVLEVPLTSQKKGIIAAYNRVEYIIERVALMQW